MVWYFNFLNQLLSKSFLNGLGITGASKRSRRTFDHIATWLSEAKAQADENRADIYRVAGGSSRARVPVPWSCRFGRFFAISTFGRLRHAGGGARRVPTVACIPAVAAESVGYCPKYGVVLEEAAALPLGAARARAVGRRSGLLARSATRPLRGRGVGRHLQLSALHR